MSEFIKARDVSGEDTWNMNFDRVQCVTVQLTNHARLHCEKLIKGV